MPTSLRSHLSDLASNFASAILSAIKGASLEDILGEGGSPRRRGPGRPRGSSNRTKAASKTAPASTPVRKIRGRLRRRSPEEIAKALAAVVALVKTAKDGLRAEQIRDALKMQRKEIPRVLQEGLAKKQLKSKGKKRATVYTAI
jgi:hypothetical protein